MKAQFPTVIDAVYMGKSRNSGDFTDEEGVKVIYGEKFAFAFESSEGTTQTIDITEKRLHEVGVDPAKLRKLSGVRIEGDVVVSDKGGYLKPTKITAAG